jgi:hypothetical protein
MREVFAEKPVIEFAELVKASGFSKDFLRAHIRSGALPFARKGRGERRTHRLFRPGDVATFLKNVGKTDA